MSALASATLPCPDPLTDPGPAESPPLVSAELSFNNPAVADLSVSNDPPTSDITETDTDYSKTAADSYEPSPGHLTASIAAEVRYEYPTAPSSTKPKIDCQSSLAAEPGHDYLTLHTTEPSIHNEMTPGTNETSLDYQMISSTGEPRYDCVTPDTVLTKPRLDIQSAPDSTGTSLDGQIASRAIEPRYDYVTRASGFPEPLRVDDARVLGATETSSKDPVSTTELSSDYLMSPGIAEPIPDCRVTPRNAKSSFDVSSEYLAMTRSSIGSTDSPTAPNMKNIWSDEEEPFLGFPATVKSEPGPYVFETIVDVERIKSEANQLLYADHEIKEEIVIGPTEVAQIPRPGVSSNEDSLELDVEQLDSPRVVVRNVDYLQCSRCGEWSVSIAALRRHHYSHMDTSHNIIDQVGHSQGTNIADKNNIEDHHQNEEFENNKQSNDVRVDELSIRPYECEVCERRFKYKRHLGCHLKTHREKYVCNHCGRPFQSKWHLVKHIRIHCQPRVTAKGKVNHTKKILKQFRDKQFKYKSDLAYHVKCHEKNTGLPIQAVHSSRVVVRNVDHLQCSRCGEWSVSIAALHRHHYSHMCTSQNSLDQVGHSQGPTLADKNNIEDHHQNEAFENNKQSNDVRVDELSIRPYECEVCERRFKYKRHLGCHLKTHREKYVCNHCGRPFQSKWHLVKHIRIHCQPRVTAKGKVNHTKKVLKQFQCVFCDKSFNYKCKLANHVKCHTTDKSTKTKEQLNKHKIAHKGDTRQFQCDTCKFIFNYKCSLLRHITRYKMTCKYKSSLDKYKMNPITRMYHCDQCPKKYRRRSKHLKHHSDTINLVDSTGDETVIIKIKGDVSETVEHKCEKCLKKCKTKWHLLKHQTTHLATKDSYSLTESAEVSTDYQSPRTGHKCAQCNKIFINNRHLLKHQNSHVAEEKVKTKVPDPDEYDIYAHLPSSPAPTSPPLKEHKCEKCNKTCKTNWHLRKHESTHFVETKDAKDLVKSDEDEESNGKIGFQNHLKNRTLQFQKINKSMLLAGNGIKPSVIQNNAMVDHSSDVKLESSCVELASCRVNLTPDVKLASKWYACNYCDLKFSLAGNRTRHVTNLHCGENIFICDICHKIIRHKFNMVLHLNKHYATKNPSSHGSHKKPKLFKCRICQMKFKIESGLIDHLKTHNRMPKTPEIKTEYPCDQCDNVFELKSKLRAHKSIHRARTTCEICEKSFKSYISLKDHTFNVHILKALRNGEITNVPKHYLSRFNKSKKYNCKECNKQCLTEYKYKQHVETHRSKRQNVSCDLCALTFVYDAELAAHRVSAHDKTDYISCDICNKVFTRPKSLKNHLYSVHRNENPFECDVEFCDMKFNTMKKLSIHRGRHETKHLIIGVPTSCYICNKIFKDKNLLKRHIVIHNKPAPAFSCDICKKLFTYKSSVVKHMVLHNKIAAKPFACDICDKKFNYKGALNQHLVYHSGVKRFTCDICDMRYTDKSGLRKHMNYRHKHDTHNNLVCEICNITFNTPHNYSQHILSHKNVKMFTCHLCGESFVHKASFTKHLSTHQVDPYKCKSCGMQCRSALALTRHCSKFHSVYTCDICGQRFTLKDNLATHILTHNGFTQHPCGVCEKRFRDKSDLTEHLLEHVTETTDRLTCGICHDNFNDINDLSSHVCSRDRETRGHVCEICGHNSMGQHELEEHLLIHSSES